MAGLHWYDELLVTANPSSLISFLEIQRIPLGCHNFQLICDSFQITYPRPHQQYSALDELTHPRPQPYSIRECMDVALPVQDCQRLLPAADRCWQGSSATIQKCTEVYGGAAEENSPLTSSCAEAVTHSQPLGSQLYDEDETSILR